MMVIRRSAVVSIIFTLLLTPVQLLADMPSQWDLNGFVLGQHIEAIEGQLGAPLSVQSRGDWEFKVYWVNQVEEIYMVFGFPTDSKRWSDNAMSIQLAGTTKSSTTPFGGLSLGDPVSRIEEIFGESTRKDGGVGNEKKQWNYPNKNYSFQVDKAGFVTSIMISMEKIEPPGNRFFRGPWEMENLGDPFQVMHFPRFAEH